MNHGEIGIFLDYIQELFPEYAKVSQSIQGSQVVMDITGQALGSVKAEDAKQAINDMYAGKEDKPYRSSDMIAAVGRIVRRRTNTITTGGAAPNLVIGADGQTEVTYTCHHCLDQGILILWSPEAMKQMRDHDNLDGVTRMHTDGYCCICRKHDDKFVWNRFAIYNPKRMLPYLCGAEYEVENLRQFVQQWKMAPGSYSDAFDDFGGDGELQNEPEQPVDTIEELPEEPPEQATFPQYEQSTNPLQLQPEEDPLDLVRQPDEPTEAEQAKIPTYDSQAENDELNAELSQCEMFDKTEPTYQGE